MSMKVLYVLAHFPQNSESYVEAEMAYLLSSGIRVSVWSPQSGYGDPPRVPVMRRSLEEALISFQPDVIHVHHMTTADYYADRLPKGRVTVRAHSFDWDEAVVRRLVAKPSVRRIFAFPHLALTMTRQGIEKVDALPVAYDSSLYKPSEKDRRSVVRLSAGLPTKSLQDFLIVGNRLHGIANFSLAVNLVLGKETFVDELSTRNRALGGHVRILSNLSRKDACAMISGAGVYMGTCDPSSHHFGMPISIAEAMATGALVIQREAVGVSEYMGEARAMYQCVENAEEVIRLAVGFNDEEWKAIREVSVRAAQRFRSDVVLPRLISEWNSICLENF